MLKIGECVDAGWIVLNVKRILPTPIVAMLMVRYASLHFTRRADPCLPTRSSFIVDVISMPLGSE